MVVRIFAAVCFATLILAWNASAQGTVRLRAVSVIDCAPDRITIYPAGETVATNELMHAGNALDKLLAEISANHATQRLLVLARPGSVKVYRQVRNRVGSSPIDVEYEPVDADFRVRIIGNTVDGLSVCRSQREPSLVTPPSGGAPVMPVVRAVVSNKSPVFFECRNGEVFCIDKEGLTAQASKLVALLGPSGKDVDMQQFLKVVQSNEVGNECYKVNPSYLLMSLLALEPRPDVHGEGSAELEKPDAKFRSRLANLNAGSPVVVFFVRDNSFAIFRRARALSEEAGFETSWELLGRDEPIKFGLAGVPSNRP